MAAATVNSVSRTHDFGDRRAYFYNATIASSGDTLATPLKTIQGIACSDTAITKMAVSGGTVTFTSGGAVTGFLLTVIGV